MTIAADWAVVEAARSYAARGWKVLPLHSIADGRCSCGKANDADGHTPGKHPRTEHGVKDATSDPDQITAWWVEWPDANVGIATGAVSGILVVDVDPRHGGIQSQAAMPLPDTLSVQTGGGGAHFYFAAPDGGRSLDNFRPGMEIKGDGRYVVAPPSNQLKGSYSWLDEDTALAPFPFGLVGATAPSANGTIVTPDQKEWVAEILAAPCPKGERNITLTKLSGYFRNVVPEPVALGILRAWNADRCDPPLSENELHANVRHKYQRYEGPERPLEQWTSASLLATTFPPLTWIVEGLLPEGLAFLAGRPKRGKSWLALQIAVDVVTAGVSLGRATPGRVLYLALEDSPRRMQSRLNQMKAKGSDDLLIFNGWPLLDEGGLNQLADQIERHRPVLVVVDTLARVMGRRRDQDSTGDMTDLLSPLQRLAIEVHFCLLAIEHHRKPGQEPGDMIDDILGSTAKTAVADTILGLYRPSGHQDATLKITGRDVEERELGLTWDALRFRWALGDKAAFTPAQRQILDAIGQGQELAIEAITRLTGLPWRTVQYAANELVYEKQLTRTTVESGRRGRPTYIYAMARNRE